MVTRVTFVPDHLSGHPSIESDMGQDTSALNAPRSRVYTGPIRLNIGDPRGAVQDAGRVTFQHTTDGKAGGSVAATLRRAGTEQTVELIPGDPSSRTGVTSAIREGLLVRDASGHLQDAPKGDR